MNSLSWFLYLADVLPSLGNTSLFLFVPLAVIGLPLMIGWTFAYLDSVSSGEDVPDLFKPKWGIFSSVFVFLLCLAIFLPSKETIYLIAGSEAGESVVTSPEGQEIINDIHQVIKHQLGQLKGDTNEQE